MSLGSVLALAAIGLYGMLSYGIARRTSEIAIRIVNWAIDRGANELNYLASPSRGSPGC